MFKKKKTTEESNIDTNPEPVHDDLIIHNMPAATLFNGPIAGSSKSNTPIANGYIKPDNKFKLTGIVIMASGAVFIGLIVYGSYHFMIKPLVSPPPVAVVPEIAPVVEMPAAEEATTTDNILTNGASSTELTSSLAADILPAQIEQEVATTTEDMTETAVTPAADSDGDGLTDPEEGIFGTDPLLSDTDKDGHQDMIELQSGYNPLGEGRLDQVFSPYENTVFGYELKYPTSWSQQALGDDDSMVIFSAPDESLIQVVAQENTDRLSIIDWYEASFSEAEVTSDQMKNGIGWDGVMSRDGLNFYVTDKGRGRILVISYISADKKFSYPFILSAMLESLLLR